MTDILFTQDRNDPYRLSRNGFRGVKKMKDRKIVRNRKGMPERWINILAFGLR